MSDPTVKTIHRLKTWERPFLQVWHGQKVHEVRKMDRDFNEGHLLLLLEYDQQFERFGHRWILAEVMHMTRPREWGLPDDLCVMSIKVVHQETEGAGQHIEELSDNWLEGVWHGITTQSRKAEQ